MLAVSVVIALAERILFNNNFKRLRLFTQNMLIFTEIYVFPQNLLLISDVAFMRKDQLIPLVRIEEVQLPWTTDGINFKDSFDQFQPISFIRKTFLHRGTWFKDISRHQAKSSLEDSIPITRQPQWYLKQAADKSYEKTTCSFWKDSQRAINPWKHLYGYYSKYIINQYYISIYLKQYWLLNSIYIYIYLKVKTITTYSSNNASWHV